MADDVKVKPTPIQRNAMDVAIELTQLHFSNSNSTADNIAQIYSKYFALAKCCDHVSFQNLESLLPKEILDKIKK